MQDKKVIITGISGQDGAYLAAYLLHKGYQVTGIIHPGRNSDLYRLKYLGIDGDVKLKEIDVTQLNSCKELLDETQPDEFYHLAGQSSVAESFKNPYSSLDYNINSILVVLEALKESALSTRLYYSSSSEIFGQVNQLPVTTQTAIHPVNPYGISKATGYALVKMYRERYGLFACSGIVFNHESYLRPDHFFVRKVIKSAVHISRGQQNNIHVGNIDIRRDFGDAREYVKAFWHMLQLEKPEDFIISSGQSITLRQIIEYVFDRLGVSHDKIIQDPSLIRPADVDNMVGDNSAILSKTSWTYTSSFYQVLDSLLEEEMKNYDAE